MLYSLPVPIIPDPIIGHERPCGQLLADIAHGNIAHAYVFVGAPHLGKFTIARWFAWRILSDGVPPEDVEGVKDAVERLIHPDLLSLDMLWIDGTQSDWSVIGQYSNVQQQHREKDAKKTDTIGIKDIEALQGRLFETGQSRHLCCLIRGIDRLTLDAAGSFLKVLEEPPPRVVFLLTAESEHAMLPTIASRTRIIRFHALKQDDMRPLLAGRIDDEAAFALHLARGAPGTLVRLLRDPDLLRSQRQLHAQAKQFWTARSAHERLQWIMGFSEGKHDPRDLLLHLAATLRERADDKDRARLVKAYTDLLSGLETNAHRGLLLERFALAVTGS